MGETESFYHTSGGDNKDSLQELQFPPSFLYYNGQKLFDFTPCPQQAQENLLNIY